MESTSVRHGSGGDDLRAGKATAWHWFCEGVEIDSPAKGRDSVWEAYVRSCSPSPS